MNMEDYMQLREEQEIELEEWRIEFDAHHLPEVKVSEDSDEDDKHEGSGTDNEGEEDPPEADDDEEYAKVLGLHDLRGDD
jgi:hypothetical protein